MTRRSMGALGAILVLAAVLYYPVLGWLYERFTAPDTYYSHGFLIPFISAYLAWRKRAELRELPVARSPWGLPLVAAALVLHLFSVLAGVYFVGGYSILLLAFGASLFLFGGAITRVLAFPLGFLIFMLPLPLVAINAVSFPLRVFATGISVFLLQHLAHLPIHSEGFRIILPNDALVVGNPCSGLRSLITLLALGSVLAYLMPGSNLRRGLVVALAVPVAIAANVLRIIVLCSGAYLLGTEAVSGLLHDATGYAVFVGSFCLLYFGWRRMHAKA